MIIVALISDLINYSGIENSIIVTNQLRGGTFIYQISGFTTDDGVVFPATGRGGGYWVRQRNPGYINASWYGAVGDNSTDNISAFNNLFSSPYTVGAEVELPSTGVYRISDSIEINNSCKFYGSSMSSIKITTNDKNAIVISIPYVILENLNIEDTTGASTAIGVKFITGQFSRVVNCLFAEFHKNMTIEGGSNFNVRDSTFYDPLSVSLEVSNTNNPDQGDYTISECTFITGKYEGANSINQYSGGGLRIKNNKFNTNGAHKALKHINVDITGSTSDLLIQGNSIEHYYENAISIKKQSGSIFSQINISGNQIASYEYNTDEDVTILPSGIVRVSVTNNTFLQLNPNIAGIKIENSNDVVIANNNCTESLINCTNIQQPLHISTPISIANGGTGATSISSAQSNLQVGMVLAQTGYGNTPISYDLSALPQGVYNIEAWMTRGGSGINQLYRASYKYYHFNYTGGGDDILTIVPSNAPGNGHGRIVINGTDIEVFWQGNRGPAAIYAQKIQ